MTPQNKLDTGCGIVAVIIWSASICLSRSLMEKVGMFTAAGAIYTLSGGLSLLFYLLVMPRRGGADAARPSGKHMVVFGVPFVLYMVCLYTAVGLARNRQQVIEVGLLNYLWPTLTLLLSIPILKKRANLWLPVGAVTAFAGALLASLSMNNLHFTVQELWRNFASNRWPYLLALAAAALWALYSNLVSRHARHSSPYGVPVFLLASGLALESFRIFFPEESHWNAAAFVELGVMVLFPCIAANVLWIRAMRRGNLVLVASFAYFAPLISTVLSGLYLGVSLTVGVFCAGAMVVAGALISRSSLKDKLV